MGADPVSGLAGPNGKRFGTAADMIRASKWRDSFGFSEDDIVAKIADVTATKSDGPPGSWAYFEQALISEKTARGLAAMIPSPTTAESKPNGGSNGRSTSRQASAQRRAAFDDPSTNTSVASLREKSVPDLIQRSILRAMMPIS